MEYPLSGIAWRKSTYSGTSGNNCVEVAQSWPKWTYSDTGGGNCVEVGQASGVVVRDTTDREGPALALTAAAWRTLLAEVRRG
jgi:hypothetical protein